MLKNTEEGKRITKKLQPLIDVINKHIKDQNKKQALYDFFMAANKKKMQFSKFYTYIEDNWAETFDDTIQEQVDIFHY